MYFRSGLALASTPAMNRRHVVSHAECVPMCHSWARRNWISLRHGIRLQDQPVSTCGLAPHRNTIASLNHAPTVTKADNSALGAPPQLDLMRKSFPSRLQIWCFHYERATANMSRSIQHNLRKKAHGTGDASLGMSKYATHHEVES